eukprot:g1452.t1
MKPYPLLLFVGVTGSRVKEFVEKLLVHENRAKSFSKVFNKTCGVNWTVSADFECVETTLRLLLETNKAQQFNFFYEVLEFSLPTIISSIIIQLEKNELFLVRTIALAVDPLALDINVYAPNFSRKIDLNLSLLTQQLSAMQCTKDYMILSNNLSESDNISEVAATQRKELSLFTELPLETFSKAAFEDFIMFRKNCLPHRIKDLGHFQGAVWKKFSPLFSPDPICLLRKKRISKKRFCNPTSLLISNEQVKGGGDALPIVLFIAGLEGTGHRMMRNLLEKAKTVEGNPLMEFPSSKCNLNPVAPYFGMYKHNAKKCVKNILAKASSNDIFFLTPSYPFGRPGTDWPNLSALKDALTLLGIARLRVIALQRDPWRYDLAHFLGVLNGSAHNTKANRSGTTFDSALLRSSMLSILSAQLTTLSCPVEYVVLNYKEFVLQPEKGVERLSKFIPVDLYSLINGLDTIKNENINKEKKICNGHSMDYMLFNTIEMRKWRHFFWPLEECKVMIEK